ncbi:MAG: hypothetical protein ACSHWZ_12470 [Sulfitobacter sp.]
MKLIALIASIALATPALADDAKIINVHTQKSSSGWQFDVTVQHGDTGWDHYVDAWRVLDANGVTLGQRNLAHPHVNEQPFTRSLSGVKIPEGVSEVQIQTRDLPGGWAKTTKTVKLR